MKHCEWAHVHRAAPVRERAKNGSRVHHGGRVGVVEIQRARRVLKVADKAVYMRAVVARCGKPQEGPTTLLCDAVAALRVAAGESSAARLRHALRRSAIVTQRVRDDELALAHLPDACQVVDFLTKWVDAAKEEASLAYLCT